MPKGETAAVRSRRPRFRHTDKFVVIKTKRVASNLVYYPGDKVPKNTPRARLRRWYVRGYIGVVGCPHTEWALKRWAARVAIDEAKVAAKAFAEEAAKFEAEALALQEAAKAEKLEADKSAALAALAEDNGEVVEQSALDFLKEEGQSDAGRNSKDNYSTEKVHKPDLDPHYAGPDRDPNSSESS